MSSGLDWRAPGSDRTPVKPSWSPTDQRSAVGADPFRATPAASGQGPVQAPIMPGLPGFDLRPGIVPLRPVTKPPNGGAKLRFCDHSRSTIPGALERNPVDNVSGPPAVQGRLTSCARSPMS